jgi:hypothetical protein
VKCCLAIRERREIMEKDKTSRITNFANVLLDALEMVAQKNATVLCKGFMYEPEIPKKYRR